MPLVLLLTGTVPVAPGSALTAADLLVDRLLELLVVQDGPHLAVAVAGPVRGDDLYGGAADILPVTVVIIGIKHTTIAL